MFTQEVRSRLYGESYLPGPIVCAALSVVVAAENSLTETAKAAFDTDNELNGSSSIIGECNTLAGTNKALGSMPAEACMTSFGQRLSSLLALYRYK